jgi:phosphoribosylanthranilate isomerase
MLRIKICGLTTPEDAWAAIELGADAVGFNFFPDSKRYLEPKCASEWIATLPNKVVKIAILVNPDGAQVKRVAEMQGIDAVQLHGTETPEFCRQLAGSGIEFEKALPVIDAESVANVPDFGTDILLLDSGGPGEFGGSGRPFPWELARRFVRANPSLRVVLAGGLTPENVGAAVASVRPFGVDVSSGVESAPGRKDHRRLEAFIKAARAV